MNATEFRQRLEQLPEPTCEKTFEPGLTFRLRRIGLDVLVAAGVIPESFYRELIRAQKGEAALENAITDLDADALHTLVLAGPKIILAVVVEPKLVPMKPGENEISLMELPVETQQAIVEWVILGCPGVPVRLKGGSEIKTDDLARFRQKQPGGKPFVPQPDGDEVSAQAVGTVRN